MKPDPTLDGWIENRGSQPGMTRAKNVRVIWANGNEGKQAFPADTLQWARRGHDYDIGWWRLTE